MLNLQSTGLNSKDEFVVDELLLFVHNKVKTIVKKCLRTVCKKKSIQKAKHMTRVK